MRLKHLCFLAMYWWSQSGFAQVSGDCESLAQVPGEEVLIVWNSEGPVRSRRGSEGDWKIKYGQLRPIAIIDGGEIREPRDTSLKKGESLWNVLNAEQQLVLTDVHTLNFLVRPGDAYCRFSADADLSNVKTHALFVNNQEFHLRRPTDSEQAEFDANIYPLTYCANHSGLFLRDIPPEDIPPCDAPELIGLSDINQNSKPEFWATDIGKWSTGIAIWEHTSRGYERIFSACPGCSD